MLQCPSYVIYSSYISDTVFYSNVYAFIDHIANILAEGEVCSSSLPFPCTRFDDKPTSHSVRMPLNNVFHSIFVYQSAISFSQNNWYTAAVYVLAPPRCGQRMLYVPDIRVMRSARRQPRAISGPASRTNLPNGLADEQVRPVPFRMRGALSYYRSFGVCNQICSHCDALFWLEERLISWSTKARPVYHRYCLGGKVRLHIHQDFTPYKDVNFCRFYETFLYLSYFKNKDFFCIIKDWTLMF